VSQQQAESQAPKVRSHVQELKVDEASIDKDYPELTKDPVG